jgi:hypothetical protein
VSEFTAEETLTAEEARALAAEAFVFGYPLVVMDVTFAVSVNSTGLMGAAPNELLHVRAFPDPSFTDVVSPNADTLYSAASLDLSAEPVVLTVPESEGRYYLMPLLSGWTDVFASPGTRTTGAGAGSFAVAGPRWQGELPEGVEEIRSPTAMAWLIGRTQTNGKADYDSVHAFQDRLSLVPLSQWGRGPAPARERRIDPAVDTSTPPPAQVAAMDAAAFFGRLAALMVDNPPAEADAPALERFARIGLSPGSFEPDPGLGGALDEGVKAGLAGLEAAVANPPGTTSGWTIHSGLGSYGTDYGKRAVVALFGLGANLDADAIYPHTAVDGDGAPLDGATRYRLRFAPGQTPPAQAFWSLTMYDERHYFVPNPIERYAIGDRDQLAYNDDGSLDLWFQHESPGAERDSNWLPAPPGPFNLILRIYWPKQEVMAAGWAPPPVEKVSS